MNCFNRNQRIWNSRVFYYRIKVAIDWDYYQFISCRTAKKYSFLSNRKYIAIFHTEFRLSTLPYSFCTCENNCTNNVNYVLWALSDFNQANVAHATKESVISSLVLLLDFVNTQSQGDECYIPLVGTGMSRTSLSHKESLHTILSTIDLYREKIVGIVNVVIYNGDKSKVSIFDR